MEEAVLQVVERLVQDLREAAVALPEHAPWLERMAHTLRSTHRLRVTDFAGEHVDLPKDAWWRVFPLGPYTRETLREDVFRRDKIFNDVLSATEKKILETLSILGGPCTAGDLHALRPNTPSNQISVFLGRLESKGLVRSKSLGSKKKLYTPTDPALVAWFRQVQSSIP